MERTASSPSYLHRSGSQRDLKSASLKAQLRAASTFSNAQAASHDHLLSFVLCPGRDR